MNIQLANSITSTKLAANKLGNYFIDLINSGEENPLTVMVKIKVLEAALDQAKKDKSVNEYVLQEAEKNGKTFEVMGATITVGENGTKYDYSTCQDTTLDDINAKIEELSKKKKAREEMLKVLPENGMVDPETGALIYRPAKTSTTGIKIQLK